MNTKRFYPPLSERGQAMILLVVGIIGLLGFTALAIDGSMIYSQRRQAQAAADAAAMAAALEILEGDAANAAAVAMERLQSNGFDDGSDVDVSVNHPPVSGPYAGSNQHIQVVITATVQTGFAQFVTGQSIQNRVEAVVHAKPGVIVPPVVSPAGLPYAIMAMDDSASEIITFSGGGKDARIEAIGGDVWVNTVASTPIDLPSSSGSIGLRSIDTSGNPLHIYTVSSHDYSSDKNKSKLFPMTSRSANGGAPVSDPYPYLVEPDDPSVDYCAKLQEGKVVGGVMQPGKYGTGHTAFDAGELAPGLYCIYGSFHFSGKSTLHGDGVTLYMVDGSFKFTGQGLLDIDAPTQDNCVGYGCNYVGVAFFASRDNHNEFTLAGNGTAKVKGLVYALGGTVQACGGGTTPDDWVIRGQLVANKVDSNGHASFSVGYDAAWTVQPPSSDPTISLEQ